MAYVESFSDDERQKLAPYFTNLDSPVFALRNLPEVVKGAMFARYSRSAKSLRRLFLDEFLDQVDSGTAQKAVGLKRADELYTRVFDEYGDDSVAQLGGAHIACEGASNILTKILEWGRLMAYLEQSTRYIPYNSRAGGVWRYHVPEELESEPRLKTAYVGTLDATFDVYARWIEPMEVYYRRRFPRDTADPEVVYKRTIRAKALDTLRGLLPAATQSNVGLFGTGQAFEALLLRMRMHPLAEARAYAEMMLGELRQIIPSFLKRVDRPERGGAWSDYLRRTQDATAKLAGHLVMPTGVETPAEVSLTDFDPDGETKVVAAALYSSTNLSDRQLLEVARAMTRKQREEVLRTYVGERGNRRHKPGRAFERTTYRFDILTDYGAFRDLQRHRLLTLEWQGLTAQHGYATDEAIGEAGLEPEWHQTLQRCAGLFEDLRGAGLASAAPYAINMAYRLRFYMEMNAREAMHVTELRTSPQGHPSYRRVCQEMHRLIGEQAGHRAIAAAMRYVDHSDVDLERLAAERAAERKRGK